MDKHLEALPAQQLLLDLPDLPARDVSLVSGGRIEILRFGEIETGAWPVDLTVSRRRDRPGEGRCINLWFSPDETPGDSWNAPVTPAQARHAAAMLVAAARAAEEVIAGG